MGWEELFRRLTDYVEWLKKSMPQIRNLTGSELTGAVQLRCPQVHREETVGTETNISPGRLL